jgi:hypothetical protein
VEVLSPGSVGNANYCSTFPVVGLDQTNYPVQRYDPDHHHAVETILFLNLLPEFDYSIPRAL